MGGNSGSLLHFQWGFFITVLDGFAHLSFFRFVPGVQTPFFYFIFVLANQIKHARISDTPLCFMMTSLDGSFLFLELGAVYCSR